MRQTIIALYGETTSARHAAQALVHQGHPQESVSFVCKRAGEKYARFIDEHGEGRGGGGLGLFSGLGVGVGVGGAAGALTVIGALITPGASPLLAAGPVASLVLATGAGAAAGGAFGALMARLTHIGAPQEEAQRLAEDVRRGGALVALEVDPHNADRVSALLNAHGPLKLQAIPTGSRVAASPRAADNPR